MQSLGNEVSKTITISIRALLGLFRSSKAFGIFSLALGLSLCLLAAPTTANATTLGDRGINSRLDVPETLRSALETVPRNDRAIRAVVRGAYPIRLLPRSFNAFSRSFTPGLSDSIQDYIEAIIAETLSTRAGGEICGFLDQEAEILWYLGVREESIRTMLEACSIPLGSKALAAPHRSFARAIRTAREWIILVHEDENDPLIDSYTNAANATILVFRPDELTYENFLKRITHEIAVFFDQKYLADIVWLRSNARSQMSSGTKSIELGGRQVIVANPDAVRRGPPSKEDSPIRFYEAGATEVIEPCPVLRAITENHIAFGAQSARGMEFEIAVFNELRARGVPLAEQIEHSEYLKLEPMERLEALTKYLAPVVSSMESLLAFGVQGQTMCFDFGAVGTFDYDTYLVLIKYWEVEVESSSRMPLADFLLIPDMGRDNIRINNGPRANFGRGMKGKRKSKGGD